MMAKIVSGNGRVRYEGDVVDGKPHGRGKWIYSNGEMYEGDWKDGLKHGKGIRKYSDGRSYEGEFKDGKINGKGTLKWSDGSVIYEGDWKDGKWHGKGTLKWSDGRSYEGEFKDSKRHGRGIEKRSDGRVKYEGEFKDGYPNGNGKHNYLNGDVYTGEWRANRKHGKGVMTYANKEIYDGEWKRGKRHGTGSFTLQNGDVISGEWINDENQTLSIVTSRKRAANHPQDTESSDGQPPAKRPHLEEMQSTIVQLHKKIEELQDEVVKKDDEIGTKHGELMKKDTKFASMKTMMQDEVVAKDEVIIKKDAELASLKAKIKKLGQILNESDGDEASNQDDEQDDVHESEAPKAKRPHVELDEEHTKCQICFTKFSTSTNNQDEDIRHLLPVSSESCDHYFCHGCITNQQVSIAEGRNGRVPKWIECMTCKAKTAFCPSKPRYHRLLIDLLTRAQWYAQPVSVEVKEED